jgi:RHS repeat-associated protein
VEQVSLKESKLLPVTMTDRLVVSIPVATAKDVSTTDSRAVLAQSGIRTVVTKDMTTTDYCNNVIYEGKGSVYGLRRILTDNGYIENDIYYFYIKDHQGNNRLVVDESGKVVQKTDYYPFGNPFQKSEKCDQPYLYGGKEFETDGGLNSYDFGARTYDPAICRFGQVDPLCEDYYGVSPYVYCLNNPIKFVDFNGKEVIALNALAQQAILNTLPKEVRHYAQFDNIGRIDKDIFNQANTTSGNYGALLQLVNDRKVFEVNVANKMIYKDENGKLIEKKMGEITLSNNKNGDFGFNTGEVGGLGATQTPGNVPEKENSPDGNVKITINSGLSAEGQAQIFSHEGYGHAYLYSKGKVHTHQVKNTSQGFTETNIKLRENISKAIQETIKNMKDECTSPP